MWSQKETIESGFSIRRNTIQCIMKFVRFTHVIENVCELCVFDSCCIHCSHWCVHIYGCVQLSAESCHHRVCVLRMLASMLIVQPFFTFSHSEQLKQQFPMRQKTNEMLVWMMGSERGEKHCMIHINTSYLFLIS